MKSTVRDVLLLGGAMAGFMLLVVMAPVGAEEISPAAAAAAPTVRLAADANGGPVRTAPPGVAANDAVTERELDAPPADVAKREGRCDPVRRLGKFTMTRCD